MHSATNKALQKIRLQKYGEAIDQWVVSRVERVGDPIKAAHRLGLERSTVGHVMLDHQDRLRKQGAA